MQQLLGRRLKINIPKLSITILKIKASIVKSNLIKYDSYEVFQTQSSPSFSNVLFLLLVWAVAFKKTSRKTRIASSVHHATYRLGQTKLAHIGVICSYRVGTKNKLTRNCA